MKIRISRLIWILFALALSGLGLSLWLEITSANSGFVSGQVIDSEGPIVGAHVRVRATDNLTITNSDGTFALEGLVPGEPVEVAAWTDGYYVVSQRITPTVQGITLVLRPYHTTDHPDYKWVNPQAGSSDKACGNCHPMIISQWEANAHGQAISNPRFYSLYNGTNLSGAVQAGPGYLNDFPGTSGNCANCHAPGMGVDGYLTTDMNAIRDEVIGGIHCDFCHKVGGVYLDPGSGSVYPNAPGVQSQRVLRPPAGENIFFGPFDDIPDPDTYLRLTRESQYCAPCHQFGFWGTPVYESYSEWLASPYASAGVTCQNCHMVPTGDSFFALPEVGGLAHPPESIPSHLQLGANSTQLLQDTLGTAVGTRQGNGKLIVTVVVTNTGAGHHVPTDHPGRHLILTVSAVDGSGTPLLQTSGETVPVWGGQQAGRPGKVFAKVLKDVRTGEKPVVSYWKQSLVASDNRIPAMDSDVSEYSFRLPPGSAPVTITAEIVFRRLFQDLINTKGWQTPDVVMERETLAITPSSRWEIHIPLILVP